MNDHRARSRRAAAAALLAAVVATSAGCSGEPEQREQREEAAPSSLPQRSVGTAPTLDAKPVEVEVSVSRVLGDSLGKDKRQRLESQVADVLTAYLDAAYLAGEYPRTDFSGAFDVFTEGAARLAATERHVLTNAAVGERTEAVVPRLARARLEVLAPPRRPVAGLTARIRVVFVQEQTRGSDQRVTVQGRLMMSRNTSGRWKVFGYDIARSSVPAGKGGSR